VNLLAPVTLAKRTDLVAYATLSGAAVNVAGNLVMIPLWGLQGAALATLAAYLAMAALLWLMGRRVYLVAYEYRRLAHAGVCLAMAVFAFWQWGRPIIPFAGVPLRLAILAMFPALLLVSGFFAADETAEFQALFKRPGS
jgi:O-antigen/teichoic acid export membrane protein